MLRELRYAQRHDSLASGSREASIAIPGPVRELLGAPNYVHLSALRADGSPRNWVVWVGLEGDHILVCTSDANLKAKDTRRALRVISLKYTGAPLPGRGPDRVCFVIAVERAWVRALGV